MSEPFLGEIRIFAGNFAPNGWALCNGQSLSITQNTALFAILGTTYGGNGIETFALPNLQGRVPVHTGSLPPLDFPMGQVGGEAAHTLIAAEMPVHTHVANASTSKGNTAAPAAAVWAADAAGVTAEYQSGAPNTTMAPTAIANAGGSQPHNNLQPYLVVNFIIALVGIFPSRG